MPNSLHHTPISKCMVLDKSKKLQFHNDEVALSHAFKLRGAPAYLGWNLTEMLFTQCLSLVLVKPCKRRNEH